MKSSYAALTALIIAAIAFFTYNPANAAMPGLSNQNNSAAVSNTLHKTGGKGRRAMFADGLAYGLSVASQFTANRNFDGYTDTSREYFRQRGCPKGTWKYLETGNCFWKQDNGRYIYGE